MRNLLSFIPFIFLMVISPRPAIAELPTNIQVDYAQYEAALTANNLQNAAYYAYNAWQTAEDELGKDPITGDMAFAFGSIDNLETRSRNETSQLKLKLRLKALNRSISLLTQSNNENKLQELDRRLALGNAERFYYKKTEFRSGGNCSGCGGSSTFIRSGFDAKKFKKVDKLIRDLGLEISAQNFHMHRILASNAQKKHKLKNRVNIILEHTAKGIEILRNLETRPSNKDLIEIYSIQSYTQRNHFDYLSAAQTHQELYEQIKNCNSCADELELLLTKWTYDWVDLVSEGLREEADKRGLVAPNTELYPKSSLQPIRGILQFLNKELDQPTSVQTIYDINADGKVENIRFPNGGDPTAIKTIEAVLKSHTYISSNSNEIDKLRTNISGPILVNTKSIFTFVPDH